MAKICSECRGELPAEGFEGLCPRCMVSCLDQFEHADQPRINGGSGSVNGEDGPQTASASTAAPAAESSTLRAAASQRVLDYELLEEIGRGGMGVVYRARQISLNRIVAVKTILGGPVASVEAVRRFRAEAEALARLRHPNIVAIYDVFERDGHHYFSMEYVPGNSLAELVARQPLPPAAAARYAERTARAIQFAHESGLLHRDLKPSNILIDSFDEPRVTDFGLAKRLNAEADLSYTGQLIGSPQYFAPEQLSAKKGQVGPRTDVYSIGAVLYHLLTGRPPFNATSLEQVLLKVIDTEPAAPRSLSKRVPRDLETICLKCLEKEPARRYGSAGEIAEDLHRFLSFEPIAARPVGSVGRAWRWCGRRKALVGAWSAVLVLLAALLVLSRKNAAFFSPAPAHTVAYTFSDRSFYDTNWTLGPFGAKGEQIEVRRTSGYTNPPFLACTNPVREMRYQVPAQSTMLAFHLRTNEAYDPAWRGPIEELAMSISAHQIDGAGNTRIAPFIAQGGTNYCYTRPQAACTYQMEEIRFRGMTANDFCAPRNLDYRTGQHPDFSARGGPIFFGYVVRDTDPKRGHRGWVAVGSFNITAFGPPPAAFPFADSSFEEQDWTTLEWPQGSPVTWKKTRERSGGNPGPYLHLDFNFGDRTGLAVAHLCQRAVYWPAIQGALDSVDVSLDTRMTPESSGGNLNLGLYPIILQKGILYRGGSGMATYSEQNRGWMPVDFMGLDPHNLLATPPERWPSERLDFSTNGGPMLFGFATLSAATFNNPEGHGFETAIDLDNFSVKLHPARVGGSP